MAVERAPMAVEPSMMVEELATMAAELAMIDGACCHSRRSKARGSWKAVENSREFDRSPENDYIYHKRTAWLDRLDRLQDGMNSKTAGQHLWRRLFLRAIPQAIIRRKIVANHSNNCKVLR